MIGALLGILKAVALAVCKALLYVAKLVYGILKFFRIRVLALYVAVCALLSIFLPVFGAGAPYFWAGFALCCLLTVASWAHFVSRRLAARPRRAEEASAERGGEERPAAPPAPPAPVRYPRYFDVEGAPQYFFAEYADRYELYRREGGGAVYIRTDEKQDPRGE